MLDVHVTVAQPYDFARLLGFLARRAVPGMERVHDGAYERAVVVGPHAGWVRASLVGPTLQLTLDGSLSPVALAVVARMRALLDADADIQRIETHLGRDLLIAPLIERRPGLRVPGTWSPFEAAIRAVCGQQVSVAAATTLIGRVVDAHGIPVADGKAFPPPDALREVAFESLGLTKARAGAARGVAAVFAEGQADKLADVRGVGPWTLAYVALRGTRDADALPAGDLVLRRALGAMTKATVSAKDVVVRAARWSPYRAYGAVHLWTEHAESDR